MRKNHSATTKAQLVLELLKEEKTISELASTYGVHSILGPAKDSTAGKSRLLRVCRPWSLGKTKDQGFERDQDAKAVQEAYEQKIEQLYILGLPRTA